MSGPRQHIVPQQMIRRFANDKGKLFELFKPKLALATRTKSPRGIIFRDNYYEDRIASFDDGVLKPIEQNFASHYQEIADIPWQHKTWPAEAGASFIDWVAALMCRTSLLVEMTREITKQADPVLVVAYTKDSELANNIVRHHMFTQYQDFISRPLWRWKCLNIKTTSNIVITDSPVCYFLGLERGRKALMVPLSKKRILFGGKTQTVDKCRNLSVREINFSLAAWAERHIFAADKRTLEDLITDLKGKGIISGPPDVLMAAQEPLFGLPQRVVGHPIPENVDINKFWETLKDSFGPSIFKN